jgi:hypothetical protein
MDMTGYHFIILNGRVTSVFQVRTIDGSISIGRPLDGDKFIEPNEIGAHALGYNARSIGICMIGRKDPKDLSKPVFTPYQLIALDNLVLELLRIYGLGVEALLGHYETPQGIEQGKTCPEINMVDYRARLQIIRVRREIG